MRCSLSVPLPVAALCCQVVKFMSFFLSIFFLTWLVSSRYSLAMLALFNGNGVYLFPFKSSVEQRIQFSTLTTKFVSCMCSLGEHICCECQAFKVWQHLYWYFGKIQYKSFTRIFKWGNSDKTNTGVQKIGSKSNRIIRVA